MKLKHILCAVVLFSGMATERVCAQRPNATPQQQRGSYFAAVKSKLGMMLTTVGSVTYDYVVAKPFDYLIDKPLNWCADKFANWTFGDSEHQVQEERGCRWALFAWLFLPG